MATSGSETSLHFNAYAVENRQYLDYDLGLKTGPYNFGLVSTKPDWVEHFPYQDGILISYWDTSFTDNNTSQHPGGGLILPIDSHPAALIRPDGAVWRSRVQAYDSTFGLQPTDAMTLHINGAASSIPSLPAVPVFDDRTQYWNSATPLSGVKNPNTGTQIRVKSMNPNGFAQIQVQSREVARGNARGRSRPGGDSPPGLRSEATSEWVAARTVAPSSARSPLRRSYHAHAPRRAGRTAV